MSLDLLIRSPRVITVEGEVARSVGVHDGRIVSIGPVDADLDAVAEVRLDPDEVLAELASFDALLIAHAEDAHVIDDAPNPNGPSYQGFLASRPRDAENRAIGSIIDATRRAGARAHIVHLSSSDALPMITAARQEGVRLTVETCPHYLTFSAEEIPDGATQYKCCPPIRERANRELLWDGLRDGVVDFVVSDHSPCTVDLKQLDTGDFRLAWGGIASLQLGLSAIWTQARRRQYSLVDVARWMAQRPAELVGLERKGRIAVGYDADLAVFAPDEAFVVDASRLFHKNAITPYAALPLMGRVRSTWLRGQTVADGGEIVGQPRGILLNRGGA